MPRVNADCSSMRVANDGLSILRHCWLSTLIAGVGCECGIVHDKGQGGASTLIVNADVNTDGLWSRLMVDAECASCWLAVLLCCIMFVVINV